MKFRLHDFSVPQTLFRKLGPEISVPAISVPAILVPCKLGPGKLDPVMVAMLSNRLVVAGPSL